MAKPIALQLYTLREQAKEDFPGVLQSAAEIGFAGVEFAGLHGHPPAELKKRLDDLGLAACSAHAKVFDPAAAGQVIEEAEALGYKHLVAGFGPDQFESEEKIREAADQVNAAIERFEPQGYTVSIHNHWWEYNAPNKGDRLLELCPKARPQLDIYWVATGGADPAAYIKKYAKRATLLHVKDGPCVKDQPMTAVGRGKVDIKAALAAAEEAATEWYILEIDRVAGDMLEAVKESYAYLVGNGLVSGRK